MSTKASSPGRSELAALNDLLDEREVPAASRATILEAVAIATSSKISVLAQAPDEDGHVALRPAGAAVAAYVHPDKLSLRFDRRRALRTAQEYEFCQIAEGQAPTEEWLHLIIDDWALEQHAVVVRRLLLSAIIIASVQATTEAAAQAAAASRPSRRTVAPRAVTPRAAKPARTDSSLNRSTVARSTVGPNGSTVTARTVREPPPPPPPPPPKPAVCSVHFVQLVNGRCDYCDD